MSYIDQRITSARPKSGEAPFDLHEVFFSRTDDRGVIEAANHVFHRVAHYEWEEMQGAPHRLIRHPDMPKGVFWLLWDTISRGKPMGAYVKNKAKDGLYYWVFAVVLPCAGGGYLSARIKPTSQMRAQIEAEYATLLKVEKNEGLSPEDSASMLLQRLEQLGFEDYHHFAAQALSEELMARDAGLGQPVDGRIASHREMLDNAERLAEETYALVREFDAMHTIPHNLRVIASRIEPAGGPVTVLSQNYGSMSRDMSQWFSTHVVGTKSNFAAIRGTVRHSMFVESMARILNECDRHIQQERRGLPGVDMEQERRILARLVKENLEGARSELKAVDAEADRIERACTVMHRHMLGLSSTRVMCKIESARLQQDGETLNDIIEQLGDFQQRISDRLDRIAQFGKNIRALEV